MALVPMGWPRLPMGWLKSSLQQGKYGPLSSFNGDNSGRWGKHGFLAWQLVCMGILLGYTLAVQDRNLERTCLWRSWIMITGSGRSLGWPPSPPPPRLMEFVPVREGWKAHAELQCRIFPLLIFHGWILTADHLDIWSCPLDATYQMCLSAQETTTHLSMECSFAKAAWNLVCLWTTKNQIIFPPLIQAAPV